MIILLAAGFAGGVAGTALAWGHGIPAIVMSAPLGASLATATAALISAYGPAAWRPDDRAPSDGVVSPPATYETTGPN